MGLSVAEIVGIVGFILGVIATVFTGVSTIKKASADSKKTKVDITKTIEEIWQNTMSSMEERLDNVEKKVVERDNEIIRLNELIRCGNVMRTDLEKVNAELIEKVKKYESYLRRIIEIIEETGLNGKYRIELDEIKSKIGTEK